MPLPEVEPNVFVALLFRSSELIQSPTHESTAASSSPLYWRFGVLYIWYREEEVEMEDVAEKLGA